MLFKKKLGHFYHKHALKLRFLVVGGVNTLVGIVMYPLLYELLVPMRAHYNWLLVLSQIICITNSYFTNKYWVFKIKTGGLWQYLKFTAYYNLIFLVNLGLLPLLVAMLQVSPAKIQVVINILLAIGSYFWHACLTFKEKQRVLEL